MNIIAEFAAVARRTQARIMLKLQFRELQSFLHPADRSAANGNGQAGLSGHTKRFKETALTKEQFGQLIACAREHDLPIYATPVRRSLCRSLRGVWVRRHQGGSCSAYDWPLLRKIATTKLPAIVSLGGLTLNETDDVVDFFGSGVLPSP